MDLEAIGEDILRPGDGTGVKAYVLTVIKLRFLTLFDPLNGINYVLEVTCPGAVS